MKGVFMKTLSVTGVVSVILFSAFMYVRFEGGDGRNQKEEEASYASKNVMVKDTPGNTLYDESYTKMLSAAVKTVVGVSSRDKLGEKGTEYTGSGVIVSRDGYIITNHHVIGARPERIDITLYDGKTTEGKTVWSDSALDLAVVKIDGDGYIYSEMGDAELLKIGERVTAIGNPLSMQFERSVTAGIVSALHRSIEMENKTGDIYIMEDLIQTDASINPGNSGGPLLNCDGKVVGINTVKVSNAEGMGFAVPINICIPIIGQLKSYGEFETPYLGVYAYTSEAARYFAKSDDVGRGLFIAKIDTKGPAFKSGLRYGDVIVTINGVAAESMTGLRQELYRYRSGEKITVEYMRNKKMGTAKIVLDKVP